jgi:HNH endonuclease
MTYQDIPALLADDLPELAYAEPARLADLGGGGGLTVARGGVAVLKRALPGRHGYRTGAHYVAEVTCNHCGAELRRRLCDLRKARVNYCSKACQGAERVADKSPVWRREKRTCRFCGRLSERPPSLFKGQGYCSRACAGAAHRIYPDRAAFRREHDRRRRVRKITGALIKTHTDAEWQTLLARFGHKCAICGKRSKRLTQDHIVPLSRGGDDSIRNVQAACLSCNSRKFNHDPIDHMRRLGFLL